jgi:hypothetical protein
MYDSIEYQWDRETCSWQLATEPDEFVRSLADDAPRATAACATAARRAAVGLRPMQVNTSRVIPPPSTREPLRPQLAALTLTHC